MNFWQSFDGDEASEQPDAEEVEGEGEVDGEEEEWTTWSRGLGRGRGQAERQERQADPEEEVWTLSDRRRTKRPTGRKNAGSLIPTWRRTTGKTGEWRWEAGKKEGSLHWGWWLRTKPEDRQTRSRGRHCSGGQSPTASSMSNYCLCLTGRGRSCCIVTLDASCPVARRRRDRWQGTHQATSILWTTVRPHSAGTHCRSPNYLSNHAEQP